MKKSFKIGLLCLILLIVTGGIFLYFSKNKKENDNIKFSKEYTLVGEDNLFVYRSGEEIINILEKGTGIVFLGFPECPWCQAYAPILNKVATEEEIDKIYYFNIMNDRKNNTEVYQKIVKLLTGKLDFDEEGNERIFVPNVSFILNGDIIGNDNETSLISGEITPEDYWTDNKKIELKEKLRSYIIKVSDGMCTSCNE